MLLGYITVGTNDLAAATKFYDKLFAKINVGRIMPELEEQGFIVWAKDMESTGFCVTRPYNGEKATAGNGQMSAITAESTENVKALHALALEMGGQCEGQPGHRGNGFYAAYFRDLDGNKLNAYTLIDNNHPEYNS